MNNFQIPTSNSSNQVFISSYINNTSNSKSDLYSLSIAAPNEERVRENHFTLTMVNSLKRKNINMKIGTKAKINKSVDK